MRRARELTSPRVDSPVAGKRLGGSTSPRAGRKKNSNPLLTVTPPTRARAPPARDQRAPPRQAGTTGKIVANVVPGTEDEEQRNSEGETTVTKTSVSSETSVSSSLDLDASPSSAHLDPSSLQRQRQAPHLQALDAPCESAPASVVRSGSSQPLNQSRWSPYGHGHQLPHFRPEPVQPGRRSSITAITRACQNGYSAQVTPE